MIISIQTYCRKDKIKQDGTVLAYIRFTHNRIRRYVSTGIYIQALDWNFEDQCFNTNSIENEELQSRVESIRYIYLKRLKQLEVLEKEISIDALLDEKRVETASCTLIECLEQTIERLKTTGRYSSVSKYKVTLSLLRQYNSTSIRLEDIDLRFLTEFERFLIRKGNQSNSIATKFSMLKAAYNKAVKEGRFAPKVNPFTLYQVGKLWKPTQKRAISKADIKRIEEASIVAHTPYLTLARDIFLFSYYTAGINFCDIARLKQEDIAGDRLYYTRHKTRKLLSYKLMPKAREILERYHNSKSEYLFPILNSNHITDMQKYNRIHKSLVKVNKALKQIGEVLGIQTKLTTYVARHSYATVLRRAGVATSIISSSLGHSSEKVTQIYLDSFENKQIDEAMQNLL